jgi:hypothetical protein
MNTTRHVSTGHLVFGLIFLGIAAIWAVGETTDVEAPALAIWGPIVLIAAGAVGLASTLFNSRQARIEEAHRLDAHADHPVEEDLDDPTSQSGDDTTLVLGHEETS